MGKLNADTGQITAEVDANELRELRRDAARYRWLRKHLTDAHAVFMKEDRTLHSFYFDCEGDIDLDAAIDAASNGANYL